MYYKTYPSASYLILVLHSISLSYGSYTCTTEFILVFRILFVYYGTYTCTKVPVGTTHSLYGGTRRYYWTYIYITELILILPIWKYP